MRQFFGQREFESVAHLTWVSAKPNIIKRAPEISKGSERASLIFAHFLLVSINNTGKVCKNQKPDFAYFTPTLEWKSLCLEIRSRGWV